MDKELKLEIVSPSEKKEVDALWVEVEGLRSSFTIGPGHSKLISLLKPKGRVVYKTTQSQEVTVEVVDGFVVVNDQKTSIVLDN